MSAAQNIRRHRRIAHTGPVRISWEERGEPRFALGKCVDLSEVGMRIESPQSIRPGAVIQLNAERIKLAGAATVKHVIRQGSKHLLGLELSHAVLAKTMAHIQEATLVIENLNRIDQKV